MSKGVLYDAVRCIGCRACQVACKQANQLPMEKTVNLGGLENPQRLTAKTFTRLRFVETEQAGKLLWTYAKLQCMHCQHPACAAACPVGALAKNSDGPVTYDEQKCIGCRYCMVSCPFEIPGYQWESTTPWVRKCTFCADRQSAGLQPACVSTCPTDALKFDERDKLLTEAHQRITSAPGAYFDHIYGESELGGTSWMYLSPVSFETLGFKAYDSEPVDRNVKRAMDAVPYALLGVAVLMTGMYWVVKRRQQMSGEKPKEK